MVIEDAFCDWNELVIKQLTQNEKNLLEAVLFIQILDGLKEEFDQIYNSHFSSKNFISCQKKGNNMQYDTLLTLIIRDLVESDEYSIEGIARYTNIPVDTIYNAAAGLNHEPSGTLLRRIITLHKSTRPSLYKKIIQKFVTQYIMRNSDKQNSDT